ncbi:aminotransferase class V-fold PLP-dependent enzyme [Streptomyces ossamyceticus]|uniref:Aminotransferase class V-fold PLP-dependent enzyme n=1 Tax=Streptomyces ossamyceticus TaxID=249581 RepID=A0ABV2VBT4_9ACTN
MTEQAVHDDGFRPASDARRFFDWASTAPLSRACVRAVTEFCAAAAAHRSPPDFQSERTAGLDALRERVRTVFGARPDAEVALVRSVSEASSALAGGLTVPPGGEVLVTAADHPAHAAPWCRLAGRRTDVRLRTLPCLPSGLVDLEHAALLLSERTAVVACTHLTHLDGVLQPVAELSSLARKLSPAVVVVDAAQSVGRVPVDFDALGVDVLLASGRKALLGPMGAGFVIAVPGVLDRLSPLLLSPRNCEARTTGDGAWLPGPSERGGPAALEGNLPDLSALHGLLASLCAYQRAGPQHLASVCRSTAAHMLVAATHAGFRTFGPASAPGEHGIVRVRSPRVADHRAVKSRLRDRGWSVAATEEWLRVSVHACTARDDVAALFDNLAPFGAPGPTARSVP